MTEQAQPRTQSSTFDLLVVGSGVAGLYGALSAADDGRSVLLVSKGPPPRERELARAGWHRRRDGGRRLAGAPRRRHSRSGPGPLPAERSGRPRGRRSSADPRPRSSSGSSSTTASRSRAVTADAGSCTPAAPPRETASRGRSRTGCSSIRRIEVIEGVAMDSLLVQRGRVVGIEAGGERYVARATLLATGGATALWARTTNPPGSVGEGIVAAYLAGAPVADLEFTQFHPTALDGHERPALGGAPRRGRAAPRRRGAPLHRRARAAGRGRPRDRRARKRPARPARDRPRALPDADGGDRRARVRPCRRADPRLAGGALLGRRHRHRPRRPHRAARPLRRGRVRRDGRTRREPARLELAARVPRLRAAGRARCAGRAQRPRRPGRAAVGSREPVTTELRQAVWEHCGLFRDAAGLDAALPGAAHPRPPRRRVGAAPGGEPWLPLPHRLSRRGRSFAAPRRPPPRGRPELASWA